MRKVKNCQFLSTCLRSRSGVAAKCQTSYRVTQKKVFHFLGSWGSTGVCNTFKQAGAELCQAQVKLEVIVDVVEEAWS